MSCNHECATCKIDHSMEIPDAPDRIVVGEGYVSEGQNNSIIIYADPKGFDVAKISIPLSITSVNAPKFRLVLEKIVDV